MNKCCNHCLCVFMFESFYSHISRSIAHFVSSLTFSRSSSLLSFDDRHSITIDDGSTHWGEQVNENIDATMCFCQCCGLWLWLAPNHETKPPEPNFLFSLFNLLIARFDDYNSWRVCVCIIYTSLSLSLSLYAMWPCAIVHSIV